MKEGKKDSSQPVSLVLKSSSQLTKERAKVISASRTKDLVKNNPELLARILLGKSDCRLYRYAKPAPLDINSIGAVVLWTKNPIALYSNNNLRNAVNFLKQQNIGVFLQLTVTGFGGTFIEPGIPNSEKVFSIFKNIIKSNIISSENITLRYDPIAKFKKQDKTVTNLDIELWKKIVYPFFDKGVKTHVVSLVELKKYKRAANRIKRMNIEHILIPKQEATDFINKIDRLCSKRKVNYHTCVYPEGSTANRTGCIDGVQINRINKSQFKTSYRPVTEQLHNKRGKQRPGCRCTFSYDIGYSAGFTRCMTTDSFCIYCYA